ncbi:hypothetical protein BU25DRAFT_479614 [Macroventuria anomochaeta]|uniref:Uncharacterized protein n=1 Tax=Macroventuria anomochaeta TaxID=301207 RepID=A0ACB6RMM3_9PLEO|nr:uncharacterized protein BU25DRAFT_479614 [Macroventuria anomochaeta]KAF2623029.1 hypothetical protein BU25DRAFT_479614 [Macroventuria anomochaeta]
MRQGRLSHAALMSYGNGASSRRGSSLTPTTTMMVKNIFGVTGQRSTRSQPAATKNLSRAPALSQDHWNNQNAVRTRKVLTMQLHLSECLRTVTSTHTSFAYWAMLQSNTGQPGTRHPFIMMTRLPGKSAHSTWFDDDYDEADSDTNFRSGKLSSPSVVKKRTSFLRSPARIMAEINTFFFDEIGIPIIPLDDSAPPTIGPLYQWDNTGSDDCTERPPGTTTHAYILSAWEPLDIIFSHPIFNPSCPETFTLHHADRDLQNILVDSSGNITGITDWDRCLAVPRCIGSSSAPLFLQKDWMLAYLNYLSTSPYMAFTTHCYRQIYAATLAEQGCGDAKYTMKSAMYQAGIMSLYDRDYEDVRDFLEKVLRCVPAFRGGVDEVVRAFEMGWSPSEQILRQHLAVIFEPEMPDMKVLADADAEIAAMAWMIGFEYKDDC